MYLPILRPPAMWVGRWFGRPSCGFDNASCAAWLELSTLECSLGWVLIRVESLMWVQKAHTERVSRAWGDLTIFVSAILRPPPFCDVGWRPPLMQGDSVFYLTMDAYVWVSTIATQANWRYFAADGIGRSTGIAR